MSEDDYGQAGALQLNFEDKEPIDENYDYTNVPPNYLNQYSEAAAYTRPGPYGAPYDLGSRHPSHPTAPSHSPEQYRDYETLLFPKEGEGHKEIYVEGPSPNDALYNGGPGENEPLNLVQTFSRNPTAAAQASAGGFFSGSSPTGAYVWFAGTPGFVTSNYGNSLERGLFPGQLPYPYDYAFYPGIRPPAEYALPFAEDPLAPFQGENSLSGRMPPRTRTIAAHGNQHWNFDSKPASSSKYEGKHQRKDVKEIYSKKPVSGKHVKSWAEVLKPPSDLTQSGAETGGIPEAGISPTEALPNAPATGPARQVKQSRGAQGRGQQPRGGAYIVKKPNSGNPHPSDLLHQPIPTDGSVLLAQPQSAQHPAHYYQQDHRARSAYPQHAYSRATPLHHVPAARPPGGAQQGMAPSPNGRYGSQMGDQARGMPQQFQHHHHNHQHQRQHYHHNQHQHHHHHQHHHQHHQHYPQQQRYQQRPYNRPPKPQHQRRTAVTDADSDSAGQTRGFAKLDDTTRELLKDINTEDFNTNPEFAKFYVIKSYSEDDIHRSIKYSIWTSTDSGNRRLDKGYRENHSKGPIYLFFSVNASGQFCGVAEMKSLVDYSTKSQVWNQQDKWNGQFQVKWIFIKDIPNNSFRHIRLTNNDNKPVTNSRDTQEVLLDAGKEVLKIFQSYKMTTSILDDFDYYNKQEEDKVKAAQTKQKQQQHHQILIKVKTPPNAASSSENNSNAGTPTTPTTSSTVNLSSNPIGTGAPTPSVPSGTTTSTSDTSAENHSGTNNAEPLTAGEPAVTESSPAAN